MNLPVARVGTRARDGIVRALAPATVRGAAVELAWIAAHVASYPFGVVQERAGGELERFTLDGLPPVHRGLLIGDVEAAGTPILLVHGLVDNRSIFTVLRRALRRRGFGRVWTMNYHVLTHDLRSAAQRLEHLVESICAQTGYERIHVIGHSMGGIVARYYVQRMGGDGRVHTLVTLGSPHEGTRAARLLPRGVCRQLHPGSDVISELAEPAPGCRTRFVAFWSDVDVLISPKRAACVDHPDLGARNVLVSGVGHMSLPIDRRVTREIAATLAQVDPGGATVAAGMTRLPARTVEERGGAEVRPTRQDFRRRLANP
ncbi:MAG TPA: alpha/beta fold hydrolase [Mycobacteriales bacterium]|nr:alpha/beta fold hydrolase [Mycobacteriales bacterium]